jgi:hypothetical protein
VEGGGVTSASKITSGSETLDTEISKYR